MADKTQITPTAMQTLTKQLLIENIGLEVTLEDLTKCFQPALKQCAEKSRPKIQLAVDKKGKPLGYASVTSPVSKVDLFLNFDGSYLNHRQIRVCLAEGSDKASRWQSSQRGVYTTSPLRVPACPQNQHIVDAGLYLTHPGFKTPEDIITSAAVAGVDKLVTLGTSVHDSQEALKLARLFSGTVFFTAGVSPRGAIYWTDETERQLEDLARCPQCVAIGPCGYNLSSDDLIAICDLQSQAFEKQLQLAVQLGKPVLVTDMKSSAEIIPLLSKYKDELSRVGILGKPVDGDAFTQYLADGFFFLVCGDILEGADHREVYRWLKDTNVSYHVDKILLSSQVPYAGGPKNTKKGLGHMNDIIKTVATCFGVTQDEMSSQLRSNVSAFYGPQVLASVERQDQSYAQTQDSRSSGQSGSEKPDYSTDNTSPCDMDMARGGDTDMGGGHTESPKTDVNHSEGEQTNWTYRILLYSAFVSALAAMYFYQE